MRSLFKCAFALLLFFTVQNCNAQSIAEDKIDDFTKHHVKRTDWETLFATMTNGGVYCRFSMIDTLFILDFKYMQMNNVFSVKEGDNLMFMTDSGNIITLYNLTYTITSPGAGAIGLSGSECEGISLSYPIPGDFHKIINQGIKKVRFYTSKGNIYRIL